MDCQTFSLDLLVKWMDDCVMISDRFTLYSREDVTSVPEAL